MLSITYVSSAGELFDEPQLREMLASWRVKNEALGVTGLFLYSEGNIIQTLEGATARVDSLFETIVADARHRGVLILLREPITQRAFPDWSMGFRRVSREEIGSLDGFNDFLQQPAGKETGDAASSVHHLMKVFKENMR